MHDLMSGREAVLASTRSTLGPRVGKYRVNIQGLVEIGARSLTDAAEKADVVVIDEIGPMELTSPDFKKGVEACVTSGKPILAVLHEQMKDPLVERFRELPRASLVEVTLHNRDGLAESISAQIATALRASNLQVSRDGQE